MQADVRHGADSRAGGAVSIPYSSGEKCKSRAPPSDGPPVYQRTVSIPYSSGEKCKINFKTFRSFKLQMPFQSLIHQGKNASAHPRTMVLPTLRRPVFQSLIHQGKNASALEGEINLTKMNSFNPLFIRGKMQAF